MNPVATLLRRLIATWLMLSVLGYGMVVMADVHEEVAQAGLHEPLLPDHDQQQTDCDHCCHGLVHLLGLTSPAVLAGALKSTPPDDGMAEHLYSLSSFPAFRPPINA